MTFSELPLLGSIVNSGTDDLVFQGLLITGPIVIILIGLKGRSPLTTALAGCYLAVLIGNILRTGIQRSHHDGT